MINYVHGFKDHSNRFEKWALRLTENGYGVIAIDLRGHGRSEGRRGYAPDFDSYLKDVAGIMRKMPEALFRPVHLISFTDTAWAEISLPIT